MDHIEPADLAEAEYEDLHPATLRTVAEQQGAISKDELLAAMNAASDQILDSYRTWVADDTEAKPRYGQIPRYDQLNAAITKLEIFGVASPQPANPAQDEPDFAGSIAEVIKEESAGGAACGWKSCSGCHETNEGAETGHYPYSKTFGCFAGSGCSECGGLGVVWDYWSEDDLKMMAVDASGPANSEQVTDAMVTKALSAFEKDHPHNRAAMRAALTAAIGAGGQAVADSLKWEGFSSRSSLGDLYEVARLSAHVWQMIWNGTALPGWFSTEADAKAAAQVDYERRILSALSQPHPADERVVEALEQHIQNNPDDLEAHIDLRAARLLYEKEGGRNEW